MDLFEWTRLMTISISEGLAILLAGGILLICLSVPLVGIYMVISKRINKIRATREAHAFRKEIKEVLKSANCFPTNDNPFMGNSVALEVIENCSASWFESVIEELIYTERLYSTSLDMDWRIKPSGVEGRSHFYPELTGLYGGVVLSKFQAVPYEYEFAKNNIACLSYDYTLLGEAFLFYMTEVVGPFVVKKLNEHINQRRWDVRIGIRNITPENIKYKNLWSQYYEIRMEVELIDKTKKTVVKEEPPLRQWH